MTRITDLKRHSPEELIEHLHRVSVTGNPDASVYKHCSWRPVVVAHDQNPQQGVHNHEELVYCTTHVDPEELYLLAQINEDLSDEYGVTIFDLAGAIDSDPGFLTFHVEREEDFIQLPPVIEYVTRPKGIGVGTAPVVVHGEEVLWLAYKLGRSCSCIAAEGVALPTPFLPLMGTPGTRQLNASTIMLPRGFGANALTRNFAKP